MNAADATGPATGDAAPAPIPGSLTRAGEAAAAFDRFPQYRAGMRWLDEFVTQPHPALGRPGAVCPRLAPALRADTVWLVAVNACGASPQHGAACGRLLLEMFEDIAAGPHRSSTALLGLFPDLPSRRAADFIDGGHRLLRPEAVERGLMLGEFHADSTVGGVHNRALAVMRCPAPTLAVRAMTPHDLLFADQPATPPVDRLHFLRAYQRHIGPRLSPSARQAVDAQVRAAEHALSSGASL
jgi:hypothetical protein